MQTRPSAKRETARRSMQTRPPAAPSKGASECRNLVDCGVVRLFCAEDCPRLSTGGRLVLGWRPLQRDSRQRDAHPCVGESGPRSKVVCRPS
jgi:hypothetical protein